MGTIDTIDFDGTTLHEKELDTSHDFSLEDVTKKITFTYRIVEEDYSKRVFDNIKTTFELEKREVYYLKAIKSLLKKTSFLELSNKLDDEQITEDEYYEELDKNSSEYFNEIEYLQNKNDLYIIADLVKKIGKNFTLDEVGDLFSVDLSEISQNYLELNK